MEFSANFKLPEKKSFFSSPVERAWKGPFIAASVGKKSIQAQGPSQTCVKTGGSTAFFFPYNWNQLLFYSKSKLILTIKPENYFKCYSQEECEVDYYFHICFCNSEY